MNEGSEKKNTVVDPIGIEDLDQPVYRIFPLWFFEYALQVNGGCLTLVPPRVWEDPFEDVYAKAAVSRPRRRQVFLGKYLRSVFAQCWSFEGKSDVLLRSYSRVTKEPVTSRNIEPRYEGVQVKTTPRKLISALRAFANNRKDDAFEFYVGQVSYVSDPSRVLLDRFNQIGPAMLGDGRERAISVLYKREEFRHEAEVRIIMLGSIDASWPTFNVDIKVNEVFEEVRFDPRLASFERTERERMARDLGYAGPFRDDSRLYGGILFEWVFPEGWHEDWD